MSNKSQPSRISVFGFRPSFGFRVSDFGFRLLPFSLAAAVALHPGSLWACAACTGQSDSPMAKGMNWGIMSLLAVIGVVLGGVVSFFVYLGKRSATVAAAAAQTNPRKTNVLASLGLPQELPNMDLAGTLVLPNGARNK